MVWAIDLDGVLWRGETPIDGSADAIAKLRESGEDVFYVSNSSSRRRSDYVAKLRRFGIDAHDDQIIHAGYASASLVKPGERVLLCAGQGIVEAFESVDAELVTATGPTPPSVDAVILAFKPDFEYSTLTVALRAVLDGARLIATNMDPLYPTDDGFTPGTGALVTAIEFGARVKAEVAGKPYGPMIDVVRERCGDVEVMVGDQPATDGELAKKIGAKFALVLSGVTAADEAGDADIVAVDLKAVVDQWFD